MNGKLVPGAAYAKPPASWNRVIALPAGNAIPPRATRRAATLHGASARELWLFAAGVVAVLVAVLARSAPLGIAAGWDEAVYALGAQRWLAGELPYAAVWDHHPVGFVAIFAIAQWLVPDAMVATRLVGVVSVIVAALALYGIGRRATGSAPAGFFAMLLFLLATSWPMAVEANAEITESALTGVAALLLFDEARRLRARRTLRAAPLLGAGLLFSVALQVKYVAVAEAVVLCGALLCFAAARGNHLMRIGLLALMLAAAGLSMTGLAAAYFWWHGQFDLWFNANFASNLAYAELSVNEAIGRERIKHGLFEFVPLLVAPAAGLLPWLPLRRSPGLAALRFPTLCALLWLAAAGIDIAMPMKFFDHYFLAMLPPLCLLSGIGLAALLRLGQPRRAALFGVGTLACLLVWTLAPSSRIHNRLWMIEAPPPGEASVTERVTDYLARRGLGEDDLYVFNFSPALYVSTRTRSPTAYALPAELTPEFSSSGVRPLCEIGRVMAKRPRFVLRLNQSFMVFDPSVSRLMDQALTGYRMVFQTPYYLPRWVGAEAQLYERVGDAPATPQAGPLAGSCEQAAPATDKVAEQAGVQNSPQTRLR